MTFLSRLLFLALLLVAPNVGAEELVIVGDYNAKPKNWLDTELKPHGIMIDLLEEVGKRTGIKFTYKLHPWKRAYAMSNAGKGAIIGFSKTTERMKTWHYSIPMYHDELVLVTTAKNKFEFTGLENLNGRKIGTKRGTSYGDDFEASLKKGHFVIVKGNNRKNQLRMLLVDRLDAVLLSPGRVALSTIIAESEVLKQHKDDFVILEPSYKLDPNYLGIPKSMNKEHLLPIINKALKEISSDGTHKLIVEKNIQQVLKELGQ